MTLTLLCGYLFGCVITAIGLAVVAGKLTDPARPQRYPRPLAVIAGAIWPLVVVGAAQIALVALVVEVTRSWNRRSNRNRVRAFADNELDNLLDDACYATELIRTRPGY